MIVYACVCDSTETCMYIYICLHIFMCVYMYICMYVCRRRQYMYACICDSTSCKHAFVLEHTHICIYIHVYMYVCVSQETVTHIAAGHCFSAVIVQGFFFLCRVKPLQHTVAHYNTSWHPATNFTALQPALQHTATHVNTLQQSATICNTLLTFTSRSCNTL